MINDSMHFSIKPKKNVNWLVLLHPVCISVYIFTSLKSMRAILNKNTRGNIDQPIIHEDL